ncbi:AAA family ATPase [Streptomyces sp. NPDC055506]
MVLVDRDKELTYLKSALAETRTGRNRMVVIEGGVGCGKSELLQTFAEHATEQGAVVLHAVGLRQGEARPLGLLRQLAGQLPTPISDTNVPEAHADTSVEHFGEALHLLAKTAPVVVCVDDAQDGDSLSLRHLLRAAARGRATRILLVLTDCLHLPHQNPVMKTELLRQSNSLRVRLDPVSREGTAAMLNVTRETAEDSALVDQLHTISAGNPLLLRALLEELRPSGPSAQTDPTPGEVLQPLEGGLYGQAALACLYRSGPVALTLGHALAVLGEASTPQLLSRMVEKPSALVDRNLHALRAAGVIGADGFRHPAAAATVLADITSSHRALLHHRAAVALREAGASSSLTARHLLSSHAQPDARRATEPWEIVTLRDAAEKALSEGDADTAISFLELAGDGCTDEPQRIEILLRTALITWRINPAAAEYRYLPQLMESMRSGALSPAALGSLGKLLVVQGRVADALEVLDRLSPRSDASAATAGIHPQLTSMLVRYGYPGVEIPDEGRPSVPAQEADDLSYERVLGLPLLRKSAEHLLTGTSKDRAGAAENFLRATALTDSTAGPVCSAIETLLHADRLADAECWCDMSLDEATRRAIPGWQAMFGLLRGQIALRQGKLEQAVTSVENVLRVVPERNGGMLICGTASILALAYTEMGRYDDAARQLDQPVSEEWRNSLYWLGCLRARGWLHLATNRPHAALSDFLSVGQHARRWGIDHPLLVSWRADAAHAWLRLEEPSEAARLLATPGNQVTLQAPGARVVLSRVHAAVAPAEERARLLSQVVERLHACGERLELAKALGDLSETYQALGDAARADSVRRRAWHLARECGAEPLCAKLAVGSRTPDRAVEEETVSVGAGGDAEQGAAVVKLTKAEHRVALLAAYGRTNRDISKQLYITVSTVEQHLTRVYQKLRITTRQEIPVNL